MDIQTRWETIDVAGNAMNAFIASPADGGSYPGVLVFMEIFGVNEHIQDVTQRIAKEGYVAMAIDYYHRVAPGIQLGYSQADIEEGRKYKDMISQADMEADARAAIDYLKELPNVSSKDRVGTVGFCFGGYVAYVVATLPEVAVTASFYGAGIAQDMPGKEEPPVDKSGEIEGYMLCLFGEKDASIPQEDIQMIESSLERGRVSHKIIVYPDADHGFFCDKRGSYHPESALDAWSELLQAFQSQLKGAAVR